MIYNSQKYQNNFDFLRLLASLLVIVNHCYPLLVNNPPYDFLQTFTGYMGTGTLSLNIFFIISGYLITQSFVEKPKVISFLIARFLRIVPAVIPLLVIVIIVAAFVSLLKPFNYFLNLETLQFLCNFNLFKIQFSLPGVFTESFFKTNSIVGSLWSLGYEVLMYFIFLIVAYFAVLRHKLAYLCFCGVSILVCMLIDNNNIELNIPFTSYQISRLANLYVYFFAGSALFMLQINQRKLLVVSILLFTIWLLFIKSVYFNTVNFIFLPVFIIWLGKAKIPYLHLVRKMGDFSYGIYLYGFPIQQFIIYFYKGNISIQLLIIYSLFFSILFGILSWHLIEKKMLRLKTKFY